MAFNFDQLKQNIEAELANPNSELSKNKIEDEKRQAEKLKNLSPLLAEFGGNTPQARAIAEGLLNQGVSSTKDIGVRKIPEIETVDVNIPDGSEAGFHTESQRVPTGNQIDEFFNKSTGSTINPGRLGIIKNGESGLKGGDVFFHLRSDNNGNISFEPQWSPRSHGFLRDNPLGKMIMAAGKIFPPTSPYFLAASAIDAAAHGKYGVAIANLVPMGLQQLANGTDVLTKIAGPEFNPVSVTPGGQIAEALGVPVQAAEAVGKAATSAVRAGLSGEDAGKAVLASGVGSLIGSGADYLKTAGGEVFDRIKGGIADLTSPDTSDVASVGQTGLPSGYTPDANGLSEPAPGYVRDENGNLLKDTRVDENGVELPKDGIASLDTTAPLTLPPGAAPDEKLKTADTSLTEPPESADTTKNVNLSDAARVVSTIPAIFANSKPKGPTLKTVTPIVNGGTDTITGGGGNDTLKGGVGNETIKGGGGNDGLTGIVNKLLGGTNALKGNYNFSWNQKETKAPEKGVAYGQAYYGNHWNQPEKNQPEKAIPTPFDPSTYEDWGARPTQDAAEGGLMALDKTTLNPTFKPTMTDSGIQASDITKQDLANQVIQHMRRGGHVIDHKTHKDVHYLASKGEPVHHIVGFMNHRKRMAEGGITSHSLGSYSDGGHLLKGPGDGMSDDIPATIADKQPARLANEEFVIPADVVSHLGNGSSESGAKVLYEMMARIRKARTGNPKQGKQIDPHKLMPKV
jgi:Ca2+-binding RTX toxin-like protein